MNKQITIRSSKTAFSTQLSSRGIRVIALLIMLIVATSVISISIGSMQIPLGDVISVLLGAHHEMYSIVILDLRLPRTLLAIMIGAALAVSGTLLQGVIRNPLASPELTGVTGGASVAAVAFMTLGGGQWSIHWIPFIAIIGGMIIAMLNYLCAWKGGVSPYRLVLIGIGFSTAMSALTTFLLISGPAYLASQVLGWMTGTIYGLSMDYVWVILPWFCIFMPLSLLLARVLNVHLLGDPVAYGVGNTVQRHRLLLLFISVALSGAAVGVAGGISFIGLMAPHIARKLVGPLHGVLIPVSALIGSLLLLVADMAGRTVFSPTEIPAGVFTAAIGAPFFLLLLYKGRSSTA
ncbi:iron ABC transporter permease [Paenibacillus sp. ACRRX]|uniref:FecCD family ABC transporter permease n=1 Tax=unclassified Paenibacillus TaxID=185978 RepID=UPI001EF4F977|nr:MULTISPECIES: iron ABC transporter permease [unclassified Paenibacillus]MCG7407369.1 iron ABC transporter permease [Paenibacillus sp. ACRRX]MDK8180595.1 iron ABC transporter permease [Paenibacillus sp. UMB4589-SE434]